MKGTHKIASEITAEDICRHIHCNIKPANISFPKLPICIPATRKVQKQRMHGFPSQPGIIPAIVGAKILDVNLKEIDFILGGSAMHMLASKTINKDEEFIAHRTSYGPVAIVKHKTYMQDWMQIGFMFERIMTGRKAHEMHDGMSTESVHVAQIGKFNVLFVAECDGCMDNKLVELKAGNHALQNASKTILQMLASHSSVLIVGNIERKKQLEFTSLKTFPIEKLIEDNKHKMNQDMNCIIDQLVLICDMQGSKSLSFCEGKLVLSDAAGCIVPSHDTFQMVFKQLNDE